MTAADPPRADPVHPVVEPSPGGDQLEPSQPTLDLRIRQQELLAELGVIALQRTGFSELLDRTVAAGGRGSQSRPLQGPRAHP